MRSFTHFPAVLLLAGVASCAFPGPSAPDVTAVAPASLAVVIRDYAAEERLVDRSCDLPWSEVRFDRLEAFYRGWQDRLATVDFEALDALNRADFILLGTEIKRALAGIARDRQRLADMEPLLGFRGPINALEQARWRGGDWDVQAAASQVADVARQVKSLHERAAPEGVHDKADKAREGESRDKSKPLTVLPAQALQTAAAVADLRATLRKWYEFYSGFRPDVAWWLKAPCDDAGKELDAFAKLLREELAGQKGKQEDPLVGTPLGAAALADEIRFEFLPYTAEELIAIAERDLAWGEGEMRKAAAEMGCGNDWHAALAQVKADFAPPGQQDAWVARTARDAIAFTKAHAFATVPPLCEESWRMTMMTPETLKTIPYAAYSGQNMQVAYAREDMPQDDKLMVMRGNNRAFTRLTVPHELVPGHHLQAFYRARQEAGREVFETPFYIEGWALYCELRLWELGWPRTPQERMGMLFWRMNRDARVIVTLRYHLGRMHPNDMVDFLVQRVGHERFGATSEVRRFISSDTPPLYQVGYLIGGLQLLALQLALVPSQNTQQQFSDAVLANGAMPIELLRARLLRLRLNRDAAPAWRWAD